MLSGMLTVDVDKADAVVKAINLTDATEDLLAACKAALADSERAQDDATELHAAVGLSPIVSIDLEAAIAKAEGE